MNATVYDAARRAGCTRAEAELLAYYVVSDKLSDAARKIGIADSTAKSQADSLRRRLERAGFKVPHMAAAVSVILTYQKD